MSDRIQKEMDDISLNGVLFKIRQAAICSANDLPECPEKDIVMLHLGKALRLADEIKRDQG